jgi:hypothetical protein
MGFATFINIITAIFCFAVLVQSLRMMRSLDAVKDAGAALPQMIKGLDAATEQASKVLAELKETLSTDGSANAHVLAQAIEIRDELSVMVGIANATADRLVEESSNRRTDGDDHAFELSEMAA